MSLSSGGYQVWVQGQNLDVVLEPKMKLMSQSLNITLISVSSVSMMRIYEERNGYSSHVHLYRHLK